MNHRRAIILGLLFLAVLAVLSVQLRDEQPFGWELLGGLVVAIPLGLGLGSRTTRAPSEAAGLDAAQRHNLDARLMDVADRDPLTGLWNRTRFERDLAHQLDRCRRYDEVDRVATNLAVRMRDAGAAAQDCISPSISVGSTRLGNFTGGVNEALDAANSALEAGGRHRDPAPGARGGPRARRLRGDALARGRHARARSSRSRAGSPPGLASTKRRPAMSNTSRSCTTSA